MTMESFLGSLWFAGLMFLVGYFLGQVLPISKFKR
jgi:membrane protein DedA with SNARE-associated domain